MESLARRPVVLALLLGVVGAVVATVLGLLTFGAQATVEPDDVPLAVSTSAADPAVDRQLRAGARHLVSGGGDEVDWRLTDADRARDMLTDKDVYGILELGTTPDGSAVTTTIVVSGAVNPGGTQVAQRVLTAAAGGFGAAFTEQAPGLTVAPPRTVTLHEASQPGRVVPLAASALLWIAGLVPALAFGLLTLRQGIRVGTLPRLTLLLSVSVLAVGVVVGLMKLWDSSLPASPEVLGFLALTAVAFASVQGALLRLLRLRAVSVLGPMYLMAPAVAGTVPQMLDPAYRTLLWSWTPFRFSAEGLRSLLQQTPSAPDVRTGVLVLGSMALVGLVVLLWPTRGRPAEPDAAADAPRDHDVAISR